MLSTLLTGSMYTSLAAIVTLAIAKVVLFTKHNHGHYYHPMCLLYFPGIDIMFTSDSREKRHKKMQNRLTKIISLFGFYILAVITLL